MITIQGNRSARILTGIPRSVLDFVFFAAPTQRVIVVGGSVPRIDLDVEWLDVNGATVDTEFQAIAQEITQYATTDGSLINKTPEIISLDEGGQATRIQDGLAKVNFETPRLKRQVQFQVYRTTGALQTTFNRYIPGSLASHINDSLESKMASGRTSKAIYNDYTAETPIRNPNCWFDGDLTCFSIWNTWAANKMAGTLVSPRHVVFNQHFQPYNTTDFPIYIDFMTTSGVRNRYTIVDIRVLGDWSNLTAQTDVAIVKLDRDVTSDTSFAKVLNPSTITHKLKCFGKKMLPILVTNQFKQIGVQGWSYFSSTDAAVFYFPDRLSWYPFNFAIVDGDSSCPAFTYINNNLVLLSTWRYGGNGGSGPNYSSASVYAAVNSMMLDLGGGYQLTDVNVSSFPDY